MPMSNASIAEGMSRAYKSGKSLPELISNPNFANLSYDDKKQVLALLKETINILPSVTTGDAAKEIAYGAMTGAAKGVPVGALFSTAVEIAQNPKGENIYNALRGAVGNQTSRVLLGASTGLGALAGIYNGVQAIRARKNQREDEISGLNAIYEGGDDHDKDVALNTAIYGGVGAPRGSRRLDTSKVLKSINPLVGQALSAGARFGYYSTNIENHDPVKDRELLVRASGAVQRGYPINPQAASDKLDKINETLESHNQALAAMASMPKGTISPADLQDMKDVLAPGVEAHTSNANNFGRLIEKALERRANSTNQ